MTYTSTTSNQLVVSGPYTSIEARIETVANVYPGRLVKRGTTDDDIVVCTAAGLPAGWAGYDNASPAVKPATIDTIYVVGDRIPVVSCVGSVIRATLATSQTITLGDALVAGATGFVTAATVIAATVGSGAATASAVDATRPTVAVTGSMPVGGRIIGYAAQSVTTTGAIASILVRSTI